MRCSACGRDIPFMHGLYCPFCGTPLYEEAGGVAESFATATRVSGSMVSGSISVYNDLESQEVEPRYLTKLRKVIADSLEEHLGLTRNLVEEVKKGQREKIEQERERTVRGSRAKEIQVEIMAINAFFNKLTGHEIFREDIPGFFTELPIKCKDYGDFKNKIENLCCLFEVGVSGLRSLISNAESDWKSRKIIKEWLKEKEISGYEETVGVWDRICRLRNMPPTHPHMSTEQVDALTSFGAGLDDCPQLWDNILDQILTSLKEFHRILKSML